MALLDRGAMALFGICPKCIFCSYATKCLSAIARHGTNNGFCFLTEFIRCVFLALLQCIWRLSGSRRQIALSSSLRARTLIPRVWPSGFTNTLSTKTIPKPYQHHIKTIPTPYPNPYQNDTKSTPKPY